MERLAELFDVNRDGRLSLEEVAAGLSAHGSNPAFRGAGPPWDSSDSERERHCARILRKFRENTVAPYDSLPYGSRL